MSKQDVQVHRSGTPGTVHVSTPALLFIVKREGRRWSIWAVLDKKYPCREVTVPEELQGSWRTSSHAAIDIARWREGAQPQHRI